jgi:hypothetical protein
VCIPVFLSCVLLCPLAAVVFSCLAVYEILGLGTHVEDQKLKTFSRLDEEKANKRRQEIFSQQHLLYSQGKAFDVDCVTHLNTHKVNTCMQHVKLPTPRGLCTVS